MPLLKRGAELELKGINYGLTRLSWDGRNGFKAVITLLLM
jgi:hypothetical protein